MNFWPHSAAFFTFNCQIKEAAALFKALQVYIWTWYEWVRRDKSLLTSIVGVITAAVVPASLHRRVSAELQRGDTSQTRSIVTGRTDDKTCKLWWRNNLHRVIWFTPCIFLSQQPPGNLLKWILTQIINLVAWLCLSVLIYCVRISVPGHREENITSQQCETSISLLIWQHTNPTRICTQHSHCSAMSTRRNHMQHTHTHTGRYAQHCCEFGLRRTKTHRRGP